MIPWDGEEGTGGPRALQWSPGGREGVQKATMPSSQNTDPGTAVLVFGKHS